MNTLTSTTQMNITQTTAVPRLGHVHLRVADLDRAVRFYCDLLGFQVTAYGPDFGLPAAFLALDDYHHHLGLNTFQSLNGTPPPEGHTGLHHIALLYPSQAALLTRCAGLLSRTGRLIQPKIMALPSQSTCATRTVTVSSCTTTFRMSSGLMRTGGLS